MLFACLIALFVQSCGPAPAEKAELRVTGVALPGRLLYARAGDLWLWQGDTATQLTRQGNLSQPALSSDGTRIAAVRSGPSYSDIVVLPSGGGEPQAITDGDTPAPLNSFERAQSTTWSRYPVFAPDGSRILFASQAGPASGEPAVDYNMSLYEAAAVVGGRQTQLYAADEGHIGAIAVAPGGTVVLAFAPTGDAPPHLLRYRDGATTQIEGAPQGSYDPAFTPDGAWLLFAARDAGTDIYAIPSGGGTAIRLTTQGSARAPAVSPDGTWLAFLALTPGSSSFDLHIVPLTITATTITTGEVRALTNGQQLDVDGGLTWGE